MSSQRSAQNCAPRSPSGSRCFSTHSGYAERDDLLVVRAVEDAMRPRSGAAGDAPEKGVVELLGRRLLETDDLDALRVHAGHHMLDRCPCPRRPSPERRPGAHECRSPTATPAPARSSSTSRFKIAFASAFRSSRESSAKSGPPVQPGSRSASAALVPGSTLTCSRSQSRFARRPSLRLLRRFQAPSMSRCVGRAHGSRDDRSRPVAPSLQVGDGRRHGFARCLA